MINYAKQLKNSISGFIYELEHLSISQWDVEAAITEVTHNKRQTKVING